MALHRGDFDRILLDVALQLGAAMSIERLLPLVLEKATSLLNAERALLALYDRDAQIERKVVYNLPENGTLPVSKTLLQDVLTKDQTVLVSDVDNHQKFALRNSVRNNGIRFMVGVPVRSQLGMRGVLYVDSTARILQEVAGRVELLEGLAALVGLSLDNTYLFEFQREQTRQLRSTVHDLKGPLTNIRLNAELVQETLGDEEDTLVQDSMTGINNSVDQMEQMIQQTLLLSKLGDNIADDLEVVDMVAKTKLHTENFRRLADSLVEGISIQVEDNLPKVQTIPSLIGQVLDNIILNAVKSAPDDSTVTVRLTQRNDRGPSYALTPVSSSQGFFSWRTAPEFAPAAGCQFIEVATHNFGRPIPPEIQAKMFQDELPSEGFKKGGLSNGLGLTIVQHCVRRLGGAVWVDSRPDTGTTFSFTVPTHVVRKS